MTLLDAIGNTPLVELRNLPGKPAAVRILGKLEGNNPGGSVKDRPARRMLEVAEAAGALTRERTIIEATSGNTGIALAMIGAAKGYRVTLCMSAGVSLERRRVLSALGAEIVLTDAREGTDGAIRRTRKLSSDHRASSIYRTSIPTKRTYWLTMKQRVPRSWPRLRGN